MVNWGLLANPFNWIVTYLIVIVGIVALTFVHQTVAGDKA